MSLTSNALSYIAGAITGTGTLFNEANARIGVGNGTDAFDVSQADLQGSSKFRKGMDTGYPSVNGPKVTFKATFAPAEANFAWNEWGIFNAASAGVMLNRVVESNSTKLSNQTWVLEVEVTFITT